MQNNSTNGITRTFGAITVDSVSASQYKSHCDQAQIRQTVTTTYPSKQVGNSESSLLFSTAEFKIEPGKTYTSTRVTWVDVPKGTTKEQVEERLKAAQFGRIQRKISLKVEDVMTEQQKYAVSSGIRTLADFQEQLGITKNDGTPLDGPAQYRQNFMTIGKEDFIADEDFRPAANRTSNAETATKAETNVEAGM